LKTKKYLEADMESSESKLTGNKWLKVIYVVIPIIIVFLLIINYRLNQIENSTSESITLKKVVLDFQNKSGVAKIRTGFTDVLVGSAGSKKRDKGYELYLTIINPSSIALRNIKTEFRHIYSSKAASCGDINMIVMPGKSRTLTCIISDLAESDLSSIEVSVDFDQISHY